MNQQVKVRRMLEWLTFLPSLDKVAQSLVLDFLLSYGPIESAIWHLSDRDFLTCLAVYGSGDVIVGVPMPGSIWRNAPEIPLLTAQSNSTKSAAWCECGRDTVVNLYAKNVLIGFLTLRFPHSVENKDQLNTEFEEFSMLIALYMTLRFWESSNQLGTSTNGRPQNSRKGNSELTERQRIVLEGIVKKKTNNAIAAELGYSVSTIRHETMRIFEILGVSNRVEAASHATTMGLI